MSNLNQLLAEVSCPRRLLSALLKSAPGKGSRMQAAILPGAPTAEQIQYCSGDSVMLWQRLGVSLLLTLVTLKTAALAAGTFTFPLWYPSLQAALRNRNIKGKYRHASAIQSSECSACIYR
jgi:hypothetical protein